MWINIPIVSMEVLTFFVLLSRGVKCTFGGH